MHRLWALATARDLKVLVAQVGKELHVGKHVVCRARVAEHKILRNDMAQLSVRRTDKINNLNAKSRSSTRGGSLT